MKTKDIFSGNACFLVKYENNEDSKRDFINFFEKEGFKKTISKYNASCSNWLFINVNSMLYGSGVSKPYKLTQTIVGEDPANAFNVDEFKTIWNILKKYKINSQNIANIDNSMVSWGNSSFLVKENMDDSDNDFYKYLLENGFNSLDKDYKKCGWILINVKSMLFTTAHNLLSFHIGNIPGDALSIVEFKIIWEILSKHKDKQLEIENYDLTSKKISKSIRDEFDNYKNFDDYVDSVFNYLFNSWNLRESRAKYAIDSEIKYIKREYESQHSARDTAAEIGIDYVEYF